MAQDKDPCLLDDWSAGGTARVVLPDSWEHCAERRKISPPVMAPPLPPPSPRASSATPPLFLSLCPITSPRILSPYLLAPLPPPPHLPPPSVDPVSFILSDGQQVQQLLEDPPTLHRLIDEAFSVLDTDGSGALSASELRPAVETMKEHVQLPPWGGRRIAALSWPSSPLSPARTSLFQAP